MGISWIYLINMGDLEMDIPTYQSWGMNIHNPMGWLVYGWCTGPVKWWCCWKNAMRFGGLPHGTKSIWNGVMISLVRRQVSAKWKICWTDLWFRGTFLSNESPNPDSRQNKNHWLATSNAMRQSDALSSTQGQSKSIEKYFFFPIGTSSIAMLRENDELSRTCFDIFHGKIVLESQWNGWNGCPTMAGCGIGHMDRRGVATRSPKVPGPWGCWAV